MDGLEINHLRTLDALYRSPSVTLAAERLGLSQQAVSQQLRRLRAITGDRLFVPSGQGIVPTPYARQLEPRVRRVLALLHEMPLPGDFDPGRAERTLAVSSTDHAQRIVVGPLLRDLRARAPGVTLIVTDIEGAGLTRSMQRGDVDLAFTSREHVPAGLACESLFHESYRCVTADAALANGGTMTPERLVEHPFVVVSPGVPDLEGSAGAWFEARGLRRRVRVSVPSFFLAQAYLRDSPSLVGFLPSRLLPCEGLAEIPLSEHPPGYEVVAACHPSARGDPFLTWVLERVRVRLAATA